MPAWTSFSMGRRKEFLQSLQAPRSKHTHPRRPSRTGYCLTCAKEHYRDSDGSCEACGSPLIKEL